MIGRRGRQAQPQEAQEHIPGTPLTGRARHRVAPRRLATEAGHRRALQPSLAHGGSR
jgi:hypothetical protein